MYLVLSEGAHIRSKVYCNLGFELSKPFFQVKTGDLLPGLWAGHVHFEDNLATSGPSSHFKDNLAVLRTN